MRILNTPAREVMSTSVHATRLASAKETVNDARNFAIPNAKRIGSIDILRGVVVILMALDHCRDFFLTLPYEPTELDKASAALFITRWVTHFCAPVFIFLAGASAWLYARNAHATSASVAKFLALRGAWLIALEITVSSISWFGLSHTSLQILWAIGMSMIALAAAIALRASRAFLFWFGAILVFGHNALDSVSADQFGRFALVWQILHVPVPLITLSIDSPHTLDIFYPLIPWIGVMMLGYAFGPVLDRTPAERDRISLAIGIAALAVFVLLRISNLYGDPQPWMSSRRGALYSFLSFLNLNKYPPSLLFLLMTLGPALLAMPIFEHARGVVADIMRVFGRVPFFFYLIHIPLIHLLFIAWSNVRFGFSWDLFYTGPMPPTYVPSLPRVYVVWIGVLFAMYWPCRWFGKLKQRNKAAWLSYL